MTRIIAGQWGGRRLRTPGGSSTRPTTDRVREALFSALDAELGTLVGARVLDLYAGSGAIGLEAESRGAAEVVMVERDRAAAGVIRDNAAALGSTATVVAQDVLGFLRGSNARGDYDVVFLDPPYDIPATRIEAVLAALIDGDRVRRGGVVVWEAERGVAPPIPPPGLDLMRRREYGTTVLWYFRRDPSVPPGVPTNDAGGDRA